MNVNGISSEAPVRWQRVFGEFNPGSASDRGPTLTIAVAADKGSEHESEALSLMASFAGLLGIRGINHIVLTRNTPDGERIDGVKIRL